MRPMLLLMPVILIVGCVMPALAQGYVDQTAQAIYVDVLTPPADDVGHYVPIVSSEAYPVMGAAASKNPIESVTVDGVPAVLFPLNYQVTNAPTDWHVVGFRALAFLQPTSPLRVSVRDSSGQFRDAAYLPDQGKTLERMTFWHTWRPGDIFLNMRDAAAQAAAGNYDVGLPALDYIVANYPEYAIARHLRALVHWDMGHWNTALADLQFLVNNYPDAYPPHLDMGRLLHTMGDYDNAIAHYQHAVDMVPTSAEAHYWLGTAARESGNLVLASSEQEAALQYDPTLASANYEQGLIQAEQGDVNDAMYYMRRSVVTNPRNADAYLALAVLRYNRGEYRRAWRALHRAEDLGGVPNPDFVAALDHNMAEPVEFGGNRNYGLPGP